MWHKQLQELGLKQSRTIEMVSFELGFYFLKYIDDNKTELITCVNTNPHLKGIPNFVVNDIMKNKLRAYMALFYPSDYSQFPDKIINFDYFLHPNEKKIRE